MTAMQVVLATPTVPKPFADASYWFGVASILIVLSGAFMMLSLFVSLFTYNLIITLFFTSEAQTRYDKVGDSDDD